MSEKKKVTQYYSDLSRSYDKVRLGNLRDRIISDLQVEWVIKNLSKASLCLEIGCGTGRITQNLVNNVASLVACDGSLNMLKVNKSKTKAQLEVKLDFVLCDASYLPFQSDRFDGVIGARVFWHIPNHVIAFREMMRVVKAGSPALFDYPCLYGPFSVRSKVTKIKHDVLTKFCTGSEIRKIFKDCSRIDIRGTASFFLFFAFDQMLENNLIRQAIEQFEKLNFRLINDLIFSYFLVKVVK